MLFIFSFFLLQIFFDDHNCHHLKYIRPDCEYDGRKIKSKNPSQEASSDRIGIAAVDVDVEEDYGKIEGDL